MLPLRRARLRRGARAARRSRRRTSCTSAGATSEAVAAFEAAEALVPNLPTLWLNKGYTCRQLIAPGGHDPESRRAADCALAAFRRLAELAPNDPRADQLTVQTWFDTDDFATLEKTFLERNRRAPDDYDVVHGLQEVYYKWGKWPQALEWSTRAATLRPERRRGAVRRRHLHLADPGRARRRSGHGGLRSAPAAGARGRPARRRARPKRKGKADEPEMVPPPPPPPALPGDVTGKARVDLADQAIAHLEKAVALRPHYADAMTYLALVWRQKSFGAVRRAGRLAAGGRSRERVAEARAGRARREELTMAFEAFRAQSAGAGARRAQAALVRACRSRSTAR